MSLTISRKLLAILALAAILMIVITAMSLAKLRDAVEADRNASVRAQVESAMSIVELYAERATRGDLTVAQAQAQAKESIGAIRFGDNDYFFVVDRNRIGLVHPNPDIIGRDLTEVQDQNGVFLFQELVARAAEGGGFTPYAWPRAGSDIPIDKMSYSAEFAPWGWVLATGVYLDDIDAAVTEAGVSALIVDTLAICLLVGLGLFVARSITRPIDALRDDIKRIESGDYDTPIIATSSDEIAEIAHRLDRLRDALQQKASVEQEFSEKAETTKEVVAVLAQRLSALSDGRLNVGIEEPFDGAYEDLRQDFNRAVHNLRDLTGAIDAVAQTVSSNASEISNNTEILAREVETNAGTLDQAATALENTASSVKETAEVAQATNSEVATARSQAEDGKVLIDRTSEAMEKIKSSSAEIKNVTKVIEDIAFQTNLLALNAGVEAARAGEAGRGFMIVAQEVRNLAGRCSEAVVSINELIGQSHDLVEEGATEFDKTRESLEAIIASIESIESNVSVINSATHTQAEQVAAVSDSVSELRAMTQRNAASLEENSAASNYLQAEAMKLTEQLSKLSNASGPGVQSAA